MVQELVWARLKDPRPKTERDRDYCSRVQAEARDRARTGGTDGAPLRTASISAQWAMGD